MKKHYLTYLLSAVIASTPFYVSAEEHGGAKPEHHGKKKHWEEADKDGDGALSKSEFLDQSEERFKKMDKDGDGKITKEERKAVHDEMKAKRKEWKERKKAGQEGEKKE